MGDFVDRLLVDLPFSVTETFLNGDGHVRVSNQGEGVYAYALVWVQRAGETLRTFLDVGMTCQSAREFARALNDGRDDLPEFPVEVTENNVTRIREKLQAFLSPPYDMTKDYRSQT